METPEIIITSGVALISSTVSSLVTWLLSRKKYNSEVKGNDINNMQHSLDFYEDFSDDSRRRLHDLVEENKELREENIRIREENAQIRVDNAAIRAENAQLLKEVKEVKAIVNRILGNSCVNMACQMRKNGYLPYDIDKSPEYRDQAKEENNEINKE